MTEQLTEHVADWRSAVVVERAARTIRNVALAGAESKNGYRYAESALREAAALYESVPVFLDHPASPARPRDRSARDLAGSVANVRYEGGRLRGDVQALDTEAGRTLLALAEADGPGVGMSHVVLAERSGDGATVERIIEVVSVDAVAFPATTRTFRESAGEGESAPRDKDSVPRSAWDGTEPPLRGDRHATTAGDATRSVAAVGSHAERGTQAATRVERVKRLMKAAGSASAHHRTSSGDGAPADARRRARAHPTAWSGSLERLLASVDAQLPGHLRRLAAAALRPGRGARAGVFPEYLLIEWRQVGGPPEQFALPWRFDGDVVALGDELIPLEQVAERLGSWSALLSEEIDDAAHAQIEQLTEQLRETAAERDRLAERLAARTPTSTLRRATRADPVSDAQLLAALRRR